MTPMKSFVNLRLCVYLWIDQYMHSFLLPMTDFYIFTLLKSTHKCGAEPGVKQQTS